MESVQRAHSERRTTKLVRNAMDGTGSPSSIANEKCDSGEAFQCDNDRDTTNIIETQKSMVAHLELVFVLVVA